MEAGTQQGAYHALFWCTHFYFFFHPPANDRSEIFPQNEIEAGRGPEDHSPPSATHAQKRKH